MLVCAALQCMFTIVYLNATANQLSVSISPSGPTTAGETYSLTCSAILNTRNPPLPDLDIPSPTFEWFYGPNGNALLPSGLTQPTTVLTQPTTVFSSGTYMSTLHFTPLSQSHTGNYTCRLGAGSLVNSNSLTVSGKYLTRG